MRGVVLVRRGHVDDLDRSIIAKLLCCCISTSAEFDGKFIARGFTRIGASHQLDSGIEPQSRQHQAKATPQTRDAHAQFSVYFIFNVHRSITNSEERARETQSMIWLECSSSINTRSR